MNKFLKIVLIILVILGILILGLGIYFYTGLNQMSTSDEENTNVLNPTEYPTPKGIKHILLVGVDARGEESFTRSDAMMLLTLDSIHDNVKLTSFVRDAYVNIPNIGYEKLTHAYAYGGADLLLQTVRENFEVDVSRYVVIDFRSFIVLIDEIGGVDATLDEKDLYEFNRVAKENYDKFYTVEGSTFESIDEPGTYKLNGYQTLAFVRMRKNDSVFDREQRQREVVQNVFEEMTTLSMTVYPKLFKKVLPYVSTNMEVSEMIKLGYTALKIGNDDVRQLEFPVPEYSTGGVVPGKGWVLQWDEESGRALLHEFLNED